MGTALLTRGPSFATTSSPMSATTSSQPWTWNASISLRRPLATSRPFARIATRLHSASASLNTCELKNTVQPRSRRRRMSARTSRRPSGSRPDIGSSRMTRSGSLSSAWAMPDALQHALRELAERLAALPADADLVEQRVHAPAAVGCPNAEQAAVVREQLLGGEVVVEVGLFRQVSEAALGGQIARRTPEDAGFSRRGKHQLQQQLQRGGLAGAVRPEKAEHLAGAHLQREPIEHAPRPLAPETDGVVLGQLDGFDRGCQSSVGAARARRDVHLLSIGHLARAVARWRSPDRNTAAPARPRSSRR